MNDRLKVILSLMVIGIFFLFAAASLDLDESTNVSINLKPEDCEVKPPYTGTLRVVITYHYKNGDPVNFALGEIFLSNQKIDNSDECTSFYRSSLSHDFATSTLGIYSYETSSYTHDNKGDLWRVEVYMKPNPVMNYPPMRETKVAFYNTSQLNFDFIIPSPL